MPKNEGVSILGDMVAETLAAVGEKEPKRALTALPGEKGALDPLPSTPAAFPNDVPTEVVLQKAAELRRIANHLLEAADALQLLVGSTTEEPPADIQKQREAEADAKASKREKVAAAQADVYSPERFAVLQAEAQAATFTAPQPEVPPSSGWRCPTHPEAPTMDDRSPRGREFKRCTAEGCKQFEH